MLSLGQPAQDCAQRPGSAPRAALPRTAAFLRARSLSSSTSSPQGFNCPSECLWVNLAAVSTSLFICGEERGEGQPCFGVMWFLPRKTPGRAQNPGRAVRAGGARRCLVLCSAGGGRAFSAETSR